MDGLREEWRFTGNAEFMSEADDEKCKCMERRKLQTVYLYYSIINYSALLSIVQKLLRG